MKRIYLDHAASTPFDPAVLKAMEPYFTEKFGNPGSLHAFGQEAMAAVDMARETIAKELGAEFREIIFTGSATEANNLALRGAIRKFRATHDAPPQIIISSIEHESILETAKDLEHEGANVIHLPVNTAGMVDVKKLKENLTSDTAIVSVMYANNEIGAIQPVAEIAKTIRDFRGKNAYPLFHTDAAQALQFLDCNVTTLGADLMTFSSHKVYGPKGIGILYARDVKMLGSVITGGGQEFGLRSGTENVPSIVGFAKALELAVSVREKESKRIAELRGRFWDGIKKIVPQAETNGPQGGGALPNIVNIYFPGHDAQDLLTRFDLNGLAVSSGSACRSRASESSYVIEAIGHSKERARSSIRFSFGRPTREEDIDAALAIMQKVL